MHLAKTDDNTKTHHYQNLGQAHEREAMLHNHYNLIHIYICGKCILWEYLEHVEIKETIYNIFS